jgi:hypothetical protein
LLLGLSQKIFYGSGSGMGRFRSMEAGNLNARQRGITGVLYSDDCRADCDGATDVATITRRDVAEMPLLTLGQQFLGGNNNAIGKEVTTAVFLVRSYAVEQSGRERVE